MEPEDKDESKHAIEKDPPEEENDPFAIDGLGHTPAPEDDRGGE